MQMLMLSLASHHYGYLVWHIKAGSFIDELLQGLNVVCCSSQMHRSITTLGKERVT